MYQLDMDIVENVSVTEEFMETGPFHPSIII